MSRLIGCVLLSALLALLLSPVRALSQTPHSRVVQKGVWDAGTWKREQDPKIRLDGDWFYTDTLVPFHEIPASLDSERFKLIPVPQTELRTLDGSATRSSGTFVLVVKNLTQADLLEFSEYFIYTSSAVYLFPVHAPGRVQTILEAGHIEPGRPDANVPSYEPRQIHPISAFAGPGDYFLVVYVENHWHTWGGIWNSFELANQKYVQRENIRKAYKLYFLLGALSMIGFYNFTLFIQRRSDKASLFLSLFTLSVIVRHIGISFMDAIASDVTIWRYTLQLKLSYLTVIIPGSFFLAFTYHLFPRQVNKKVAIISWASCVAYCIFCVFSPTVLMTKTLIFPQLHVLSASGYTVIATILAFRAGETGARLSLAGSFLLFLAGLNDVLNTQGFAALPFNTIVPATVVFIFIQSQLVGRQFAHAFEKSERLGRDLQKEVGRQTRSIRSILQSIKQGIFTVGNGGQQLDEEYSDFTELIFEQKSLNGLPIQDVFYKHLILSEDEKSQIQSALDFIIGGPEFSYDTNSHCLPREVKFLSPHSHVIKTLEVDWTPIFGPDLTVERILVAIRDVTDLRDLQHEANERQKELDMIGQILNVPPTKFVRFIRQARDMLSTDLQSLETLSQERGFNLKASFARLHTLKGMSRTFGLAHLSSQIHATESLYHAIIQEQKPIPHEDIHAELAAVQDTIQTYQHLFESKLGKSVNDEEILVSKFQMKRLYNEIQKGETAYPQALSMARRLAESVLTTPGQNLFEEIFKGAASLAAELGKLPPRVTILAQNVSFTEDGVETLYKVMPHLIRNALDHGIEHQEERAKAGKDSRGELIVHVDPSEDGCCISVQDDGQGLDLERILRKSREKGLVSEAQTLSRHEIAQLIFVSGFSTKDAVTEVSGRGVGMDAVKSMMEEVGGRVELELSSSDPSDIKPRVVIKIFLPKLMTVELSLAS